MASQQKPAQPRELHADDFGNLITEWRRSDASFNACMRFIFDGLSELGTLEPVVVESWLS